MGTHAFNYSKLFHTKICFLKQSFYNLSMLDDTAICLYILYDGFCLVGLQIAKNQMIFELDRPLFCPPFNLKLTTFNLILLTLPQNYLFSIGTIGINIVASRLFRAAANVKQSTTFDDFLPADPSKTWQKTQQS